MKEHLHRDFVYIRKQNLDVLPGRRTDDRGRSHARSGTGLLPIMVVNDECIDRHREMLCLDGVEVLRAGVVPEKRNERLDKNERNTEEKTYLKNFSIISFVTLLGPLPSSLTTESSSRSG